MILYSDHTMNTVICTRLGCFNGEVLGVGVCIIRNHLKPNLGFEIFITVSFLKIIFLIGCFIR